MFYDTVKNHIRGENYGDLLTPIVFGKLPKEVQKSLARDHSNREWRLDELRSSIIKEIQILETEIHTSGHHDQPDTPPMMTALFYMNTHQHPPQLSNSRKPLSCIYCKQQPSPNSCDKITNPQDRLAIIKKNNLCFNCLAHHKVSQCISKFRWRHCKSTIQVSTQSAGPEKTEQVKTDSNEAKKTTITLTPATQESNVMQSTTQASLCLLCHDKLCRHQFGRKHPFL